MKPVKRALGEAVTYMPCHLDQKAMLVCYNGPFDGECRIVTVQECMDGFVAVWDRSDDVCEVYETVIRFTKQNGFEGTVLRWVPS